MKLFRTLALLSLAAGTVLHPAAGTEDIPVPNHSFELPDVIYVGTYIDSWQKNPKPEWYEETGGFTWDQLSGIFLNTPPTSSDHIDNCDGDQAIWLFAVPEVGLFQDYNSLDWNDEEPSHDFDAAFEPGKKYRFTIGAIGGGGGMLEGASIELAFYYRDAQSNAVTVAAASISHSNSLFPTRTHLVDVHVETRVVQPEDPWAGQRIGIRLVSTVSLEMEGGYWDFDNVRLTATGGPTLAAPILTEGGFGFTLQSEPGGKFDLLGSADLTLPPAAWTTIRTVTNETGSDVIQIPLGPGVQQFYQLREVP
jgi:hypothetical protein